MTLPAPEPVLSPDALAVGDRVLFIARADSRQAADDPLYEPPVPAGATGLVVKVAADYVRVRLDDRSIAPEPVRLWRPGLFPDDVTSTLQSIQRLG